VTKLKSVEDNATGSDSQSKLGRIATWMGPYVNAVWGLRNHWFPAAFSKEVPEDGVLGITLGGENILLRRSRGKVYALKDECVHRGVRISAKPTCLTKDTVTCWYHGFTYNLNDGVLHSIVAAPDEQLIGKVGIRTYMVEEISGIVFVFLGDEDVKPHPLAYDLPPRVPSDAPHPTAYLLDENTVALGIHRKCHGNWRLAAESGGDPGHILVHRNSALVLSQDIGLSLGEATIDAESIISDDEGWPKGVRKDYDHMNFIMENKALNIRARGTKAPVGVKVSLYLPGVLYVENWPVHGLAQYEFYTPIDEHNHDYWQILTKTCNTPEEKEDWEIRYKNAWEDLALKSGFNDDDIFPREAMEPFYYDNHRGWAEEQLFSLDEFTIRWRRLVVKFARGIQPPPGTRPGGR
jgi:phenylpropionate dioxygenase-like ring-hydroxylating dioxygenase large terminal subunit